MRGMFGAPIRRGAYLVLHDAMKAIAPHSTVSAFVRKRDEFQCDMAWCIPGFLPTRLDEVADTLRTHPGVTAEFLGDIVVKSAASQKAAAEKAESAASRPKAFGALDGDDESGGVGDSDEDSRQRSFRTANDRDEFPAIEYLHQAFGRKKEAEKKASPATQKSFSSEANSQPAGNQSGSSGGKTQQQQRQPPAAKLFGKVSGVCDVQPGTDRLLVRFLADNVTVAVSVGVPGVTAEQLNAAPTWSERALLRSSLGYSEQAFVEAIPRHIIGAANRCREMMEGRTTFAGVRPPFVFWLAHCYACGKAQNMVAGEAEDAVVGIAAVSISTAVMELLPQSFEEPLPNPFCPVEDLSTLDISRDVGEYLAGNHAEVVRRVNQRLEAAAARSFT